MPAQHAEAMIVHALSDALALLERLPETPQVRGLRARARTFTEALQGWTAEPPSPAGRVNRQ